jgi:plasmid stabilization system protein ParE
MVVVVLLFCMSGFVLHPDAYIDLDEIWEYIAADSPDAAHQTIKKIYESAYAPIIVYS